MRLKNNLYTIQTIDKDSRKALLRLNPDNFIYKAHFPGFPVTPGVCIVQIGSEILGDLLGVTPVLVGIRNAKYLSVINPLETPEIMCNFTKIEVDAEKGVVKAAFTICDAEGHPCSKISAHYHC